MALRLTELPTELLDHTLQYLALSDLLSFARTSKSNYRLSLQALTSLDLAVFPRRIHSLLAFFDASDFEDEEDTEQGSSLEDPPSSRYWTRHSKTRPSFYQVGLITPYDHRRARTRPRKSPSNLSSQPSNPPPTALSLRTTEISAQNTLATRVLTSPSLHNLRSLTLRLYDLTSQTLTTTLATHFPHLQYLSLDFAHPYIHDTTLPTRYWKETVTTGTPIWNALAGVGETNQLTLQLRALRTLKVSRCGITSFQLQHWIQSNPFLKELDLNLCRGVDIEFMTWLAEYLSPNRGRSESDGEGEGEGEGERQIEGEIEIIQLQNCAMLETKTEGDLNFVRSLARGNVVQELSLRGCKGVSEEAFSRVCASIDIDDDDSDDDSQYRHGHGYRHGCGWGRLRKTVSPAGVVVRRRPQRQNQQQHIPHMPWSQTQRRRGSVSPALSVDDGMIPTRSDKGSGTTDSYFELELGLRRQGLGLEPALGHARVNAEADAEVGVVT